MTETKLTNAAFAVLGLVAEKPRHGYALEQVIHERGMRDWTEIGFSSIYFVLEKLQKAGLVVAEKPAGAKARKIFSVTPEGEAALVARTLDAIAAPQPTYPSILLGLANWPVLSSGVAMTALADREQAIGKILADVSARRAAQQPLPDFVDEMFAFSLGQLEAEQKWIAAAITRLGEKEMEKTDFKKTLKEFYGPSPKKIVLVDVPVMQFIKVDGKGIPGGPDYQRALEWLYGVSYPIKFMSKQQLGKDYVVPPLEGLWWADDMSTFITREKDKWSWCMMMMQPDWITADMYAAAVEKAGKKLGEAPASLRLEPYDEGLSVQIMHIGSYDDEGPIIAKMHKEFLPENGLVENGHHHEIYIGDPRKTAPEKLKTVLRQPVRQV